MQRFSFLLIFCTFFFVGCFRGAYYWHNALFEVQVNSHYWQDVYNNDTIIVKDISGDISNFKGNLSTKNKCYRFECDAMGIDFDSIPNCSGRIDFSYFAGDTLFLLLDLECGDVLNIKVAEKRINLFKTPYNPNFKNSRYEEKILKKIKARL